MTLVKPATVKEGRANSAALSNQNLAIPGDWDSLRLSSKASEFLTPVGTHWVERDVLGVAEEVYKITDGKCRVASCQCGKCLEKGHFPHVVVELGKDGRTHPVFGFTRFGPHVTQRIREIHISQNPNKKSMENNRKIHEARKQKARDLQTERLEIVEAALKSHKFDWRGPNGIRTKA